MSEVRITVTTHGPLLVRGPVTVVGSDDEPLGDTDGDVALCRCGASATKPFCDGSHHEVEFRSEVVADD